MEQFKLLMFPDYQPRQLLHFTPPGFTIVSHQSLCMIDF